VKFLCDRCKTRYSIGDDRVRGKILKIRCKNCANVITVREGMSDAEAAPDPSRRKSPTTNAPMAQSVSSSQGALSAAFSAQMAKPPPALEEEWYVSIDGDQSGPFSLAEAQRWVASKPYDAELHCWSEGFDDWLAVDKVSHFRGLRKRPAPAPAPPPLPRVGPRLAPMPGPAATKEEEPKPLFAATMAVLEKGSGAVRVPQTSGSSAPAPAKTNGAGVSAKAYGAKSAPAPVAAIAPAVNKSGPARSPTVQGVGGAMSPGAKALATAFDVDMDDPGESMTAVQAPPFGDELDRPGPFSAKPRAFDPAPALSASAAASARASSGVPEDDGLEIGEVSRVVNLADISRGMGQAPARKSTGRAPGLRGTGSVGRISAAEIPSGVAAAIGAIPGALLQPIPSESIVAAAPVAASRRGMIILLVAAGALLAGVLVAVMVIFNSGSGDENLGSLHQAREIDTSRPEDIVRKIASQAQGSGSPSNPRPGIRHWTPGQGQHITGNPNTPDETDPTKRELDGDEVSDMAAKQGDGTAFCYKRAQRGALGIEIQDLKRMDVVLTIDKEGVVQSVSLSSHSTDALGLCLSSRIRGWKFRESSGTKSFKITLVFSRA
jgi:predicted Zn finger-like uncharacterized protein